LRVHLIACATNARPMPAPDASRRSVARPDAAAPSHRLLRSACRTKPVARHRWRPCAHRWCRFG